MADLIHFSEHLILDGYNYAYGIVKQSDGKLVIAGSHSTLSGKFGDVESKKFHVMRLSTNYILDTSFGNNGHVSTVVTPFDELWQINDVAYDLALQPDGRIILVGSTPGPNGQTDFAMVRHMPSGSLDTCFGSGGIVTTSFGTQEFATEVAIAPRGSAHVGKIVVAGSKANGIPIALYLSTSP